MDNYAIVIVLFNIASMQDAVLQFTSRRLNSLSEAKIHARLSLAIRFRKCGDTSKTNVPLDHTFLSFGIAYDKRYRLPLKCGDTSKTNVPLDHVFLSFSMACDEQFCSPQMRRYKQDKAPRGTFTNSKRARGNDVLQSIYAFTN